MSGTGLRVRRPAPVVLAAGIACALACVVLVGLVSGVNPVDFYVYRYGAGAALGGANIYDGNVSGVGLQPGLPFTYTPVAALVLAPTVLLAPFTAYVLWCLATLVVLAWALSRFVPADVPRRPLVLAGLVLAASVSNVMVTQISFGQVNVLLMGLVLADLFRADDTVAGRVLPRGLLVGLATAVKLTPGLFVVYFLVTRQWRLALWSSVGAVGATLVGAVVFPSMSWDFFSSVLWGLSSRIDLDGLFASPGNGSIQGAFAALGVASSGPALGVSLVVAVVVLCWARTLHRSGRAVDGWLVVGLAAPLLSPVSWVHHWVYLLPALVTLAVRGRSRPVRAVLVGAGVLVLLGPGWGDAILGASPLLVPVGVVVREGLMIASIGVIAALRFGALARGPELSSR